MTLSKFFIIFYGFGFPQGFYTIVNMVAKQQFMTDIPVGGDDDEALRERGPQRKYFTELLGKVIDLRNIAKLPSFSGTMADWQDYRFRLESLASLVQLRRLMDTAITADTAALEDMEINNVEQSQVLYSILIQTCSGRALALLHHSEPGEGLTSWKALKLEYEPEAVSRHVAMLGGLLSPGWQQDQKTPFWDQLIGWETAVRRYERTAGAQLPEAIKAAVVAQHAPPKIKELIRASSEELVLSYAKLREAIRT